MASGGVSTPDRLEKLTCTICLDLFRSPRLLPCHHTFCLECLQDLAARYNNRAFPCPTCRRTTQVPAGGMTTFQVNFYLEEDADAARKASTTNQLASGNESPSRPDLFQWLASFDPEDVEGDDSGLCKKHPGEKLRFVCLACNGQVICRDCKLTRHEGHKTDDLDDQVECALKRLKALGDRVDNQVKRAVTMATVAQERQQATYDKRLNMIKMVRDRADLLIKWVEDGMTAAVTSLCSKGYEIDVTLMRNTADASHCLTTGKKLHSILQQTLRTDRSNAAAFLQLEKQLQGRDEELKKMTDGLSTMAVSSGFISNDADVSAESIREFILSNFQHCVSTAVRDMFTIKPVFQVKCDINMMVHSICPVAGGKMWVAFGSCAPNGKGCVVLVTEDGEEIRREEIQGRVSLTSLGDDKVRVAGKHCQPLFLDAKQSFEASIFNGNNVTKGCEEVLSTRKARYCMVSDGNSCRMVSEKVSYSETRVQIVRSWVNDITWKPIAFDVNSAGTVFALVREDDSAVCLHRPGDQTAVSMFRLSKNDLPRSVCFCRVDSQELLLVASFGYSTVDLYSTQGYELTMITSMGADCPQLLKPTAVAADDEGRVWIGCQGGQILVAAPNL